MLFKTQELVTSKISGEKHLFQKPDDLSLIPRTHSGVKTVDSTELPVASTGQPRQAHVPPPMIIKEPLKNKKKNKPFSFLLKGGCSATSFSHHKSGFI